MAIGLKISASLLLAVLAGFFALAPASAQVKQPPPGARSPLSPPESNPVQAEAFRRGYEAYYRGQYERAAAIWLQLADQGHVKSMNNIATMYAQGKGVGRNDALAVVYYRRAAAQNDARAAYNLGLAYERGRGVAKSDRDAVASYLKAAQRGLVEGMNATGWLLATSQDPGVRNGREAMRWAQSAVQRKASATHLATLAAAQAEVGDFSGAVKSIDQAIALAKREVDGAGLVTSGSDPSGLLRNAGRQEELSKLLARRQDYLDRKPTRD